MNNILQTQIFALRNLVGGRFIRRTLFNPTKSSVRMASKNHSLNYEKEDEFIQGVFKMCIKDAVTASRERSNPVIEFKTPEELLKIIDFKLTSEGTSNKKLLEECKKVIKFSQKTGHPYFFNQMYGGIDQYGLGGSLITDSLNTNGHTFEVSPVFSVAETVIIQHMKSLLGFNGDGTFCPGGSYCGLLAMASARCQKFPEIKQKGSSSFPQMSVFCSEQAHYSAQKNSMMIGVGLDNCHSIPCNNKGQMEVDKLEEAIIKSKEQGSTPIMVIATAGTTVLGAFDPFDKIADLCLKYNIWMHVDAAWGGSALVTNKYRYLLNGSERANSFAWNAHKLLKAPIQSSILLFREKDVLKKTYSTEVKYLFQNDKPYDMEYDLGRNLLQCSRSCSAFKLWLMWKALGDQGLCQRVETAWDNALYLLEQVKKRPNFKLVLDEIQGPNVCFWYITPSLRKISDEDEMLEKAAQVVPKIKVRLQKKGNIMVGYAPVADKPTFIRMVLVNDNVCHEDMDYLLDEIELAGQDL